MILLFCRCAEGYMGPRCEYKDLDGSYLRKLHFIIIEVHILCQICVDQKVAKHG